MGNLGYLPLRPGSVYKTRGNMHEQYRTAKKMV